MKQIKAIVLGAGNRGKAYSKYSLRFPDELKIVSVAEADAERRKIFALEFEIESDKVFDIWELDHRGLIPGNA